MHPAYKAGIVAVVAFNLWRFAPAGPWPFITYAAAPLIITWSFGGRLLWPSIGLCVTAAIALITGDIALTRVSFIVGLTAVAWESFRAAKSPLWYAFTLGLISEIVVWFLGNTSRGEFGELARSAIGSAYGPWAHPTQLIIIALTYALASRFDNGRSS